MTIWLVIMDRGGIFGAYAERDRADDAALNINGILAEIPVVADYREPEDQADDVAPRPTDPWVEIHHPDKHKPAADQGPKGRAYAELGLYLCECGGTHNRPVPAPTTSRATPDDRAQMAELGWQWYEIPTSYIGLPETEAETVEWLRRGDEAGDPGPRPVGRRVCFHCQSAVNEHDSCTNPECPGKLQFLLDLLAEQGKGAN